MKKITTLFIMMAFCFLNAQEKGLDVFIPDCIISGPTEINAGEAYTFSIPGNLGQCSNCYDWDLIAGANNASIGFDQNNTVTVNANNPGNFSLRVTYFDETGCHTCARTFTIVENNCPFDPTLMGKSDCFPKGGSGNVKFDTSVTDLSNVATVTWILDPMQNQTHYQGFEFTNSGGPGITIEAPSINGFNAPFTHNGSCATQGLFVFDLIVTFDNGCPDYLGNDLHVFLQNHQPQPVINLYPNPLLSGEFVKFGGIDANEISDIQVLDLSGAEKINIKPTKQNFSTKELIPGIYIVRFITIDNEIIQKKLLIE